MSDKKDTQDRKQKFRWLFIVGILLVAGLGGWWLARGRMPAQPESTPVIDDTENDLDEDANNEVIDEDAKFMFLGDVYDGWADGEVVNGYAATWARYGETFWLWQSELPAAPERIAHTVSFKLDPGFSYAFNGVAARLYIDPDCDGEAYLEAELVNDYEFSVETDGLDHVCGRVDSNAGVAAGFSIIAKE